MIKKYFIGIALISGFFPCHAARYIFEKPKPHEHENRIIPGLVGILPGSYERSKRCLFSAIQYLSRSTPSEYFRSTEDTYAPAFCPKQRLWIDVVISEFPHFEDHHCHDHEKKDFLRLLELINGYPHVRKVTFTVNAMENSASALEQFQGCFLSSKAPLVINGGCRKIDNLLQSASKIDTAISINEGIIRNIKDLPSTFPSPCIHLHNVIFDGESGKIPLSKITSQLNNIFTNNMKMTWSNDMLLQIDFSEIPGQVTIAVDPTASCISLEKNKSSNIVLTTPSIPLETVFRSPAVWVRALKTFLDKSPGYTIVKALKRMGGKAFSEPLIFEAPQDLTNFFNLNESFFKKLSGYESLHLTFNAICPSPDNSYAILENETCRIPLAWIVDSPLAEITKNMPRKE